MENLFRVLLSLNLLNSPNPSYSLTMSHLNINTCWRWSKGESRIESCWLTFHFREITREIYTLELNGFISSALKLVRRQSVSQCLFIHHTDSALLASRGRKKPNQCNLPVTCTSHSLANIPLSYHTSTLLTRCCASILLFISSLIFCY